MRPFRRFDESHPLSQERRNRRRDGKKGGWDSTERRILFTSSDTYAFEGRGNRELRHSVSRDPPRRPAAVSLRSHENPMQAARRCFPIFRKPRTRATFTPPEYCHFARIVSDVKHCHLNMDKAKRASFIRRYQGKYVIRVYVPRLRTFDVIGLSGIVD